MAKAKSKTVRAAPDQSVLLERALVALARDGALKLTALGPQAVRAALASELAKQGFEVTSTTVRKPLATQLASALSDGAFIPLKSAASHVVGAAAAEAKQAVLALVASGAAKLVLRGTEEVVVPMNAPVLSRDALARFGKIAAAVAKTAKSKHGASLLQADFLDALTTVLPGVSLAPTASAALAESLPKVEPQAPFCNLLLAVEAARDSQTGLSFVPAVVAKLRPTLAPKDVTAALLAAATAGLLELRPEGGINRLSAEELSMCPEGPQGTRLSWARRTGVDAR